MFKQPALVCLCDYKAQHLPLLHSITSPLALQVAMSHLKQQTAGCGPAIGTAARSTQGTVVASSSRGEYQLLVLVDGTNPTGCIMI